MTDKPEPLSPPDCDLRGYDFMPLFGTRLFTSEFNAIATDAEFRAAVNLWWAAYLSKPGGSLPNEDRQLAMAAGLGRDVKSWLKVKAVALHGFVECADGRLYHTTVAAEAVKSYDLRLKSDQKRATDRKRLQEWRDSKKKPASNNDGNNVETGDETRFMNVSKHGVMPVSSEVDQTIYSSLRSEGGAQDREQTGTNHDTRRNPPEIPDLLPEDAPPTPEQTAKKTLFSDGLRIVRELTGDAEPAAKTKLGKLRKAASDNDLLLLDVLRQAEKLQPADAFPWLIAAIKTKKPQENTAKSVKSVWKDGSDNQGIYAWLSREIDVVDTPGDDIWRSCIGGFYADCIAEEIVTILELPAGWRGDWSALGRWLRDDISPGTIFETLRNAVFRGLPAISSMQFFDGAVRQAAARAA